MDKKKILRIASAVSGAISAIGVALLGAANVFEMPQLANWGEFMGVITLVICGAFGGLSCYKIINKED
ncbi:MAG: hypothetical protein FWC13_05405 [Oscillospiraceae bacterium]|nr:hypothetical protein [Oscillospiraceae bacterium]